ncbi:hypothetical protein DL93DRAFT_1335051 [Clavulina sp. PMI_390]|nr:hypothetical protein DL93DRAFT_1335051 [Clavulina sp. PMI_390]
MSIPFLRRRAQIDDPFAAEGTNWADAIGITLVGFVFCLVCLPGFLMFLGFSVVSLHHLFSIASATCHVAEDALPEYLKTLYIQFAQYFAWNWNKPIPPKFRWAWPVWGGLCAVIGGSLIIIIIVGCFRPCGDRYRQRAEDRRLRREELLRSNGVLALLPAMAVAAPPPVAMTEALRNQGAFEAQAWVSAAAIGAQNPMEVEPVKASPQTDQGAIEPNTDRAVDTQLRPKGGARSGPAARHVVMIEMLASGDANIKP